MSAGRRCRQEFARLWEAGGRPNLVAAIQSLREEPDFLSQALLLAQLDLRKRIAAGDQPPLVETILHALKLAGAELELQSVAALAQLEFELRWRSGERDVRRDEYRDRFPEFSEEIAGWEIEWTCPECRWDRNVLPADATEPATCSRCGSTCSTTVLAHNPERRSHRTFVLDRREYELDSAIGVGGMGEVYRGRDPGLDRELAIKVIRKQYADSPQVLTRFYREAQILGQLEHPGIVPIHNLGKLCDGRPFLAMKLVRGDTLATRLSQTADRTARERLAEFRDVFAQISRAMAYAHQQDVVHRDLKPENVMLGEFGEVHIMDWGLAKHLGESAGRTSFGEPETVTRRPDASNDESTENSLPLITQDGEVLGTLPYMPSEQAQQAAAADRRSDVYALGAILCEILTGAPPCLEIDDQEQLRALHEDLVAARRRANDDPKNSARNRELAQSAARLRTFTARLQLERRIKDPSRCAAAGMRRLAELAQATADGEPLIEDPLQVNPRDPLATELVPLVMQCLASDPEKRPQSAGALWDAFQGYLTAVQQASDERLVAEVKRRRTQVVAGLAVVLAVGALASMMWIRRANENLNSTNAELTTVNLDLIRQKKLTEEAALEQTRLAEANGLLAKAEKQAKQSALRAQRRAQRQLINSRLQQAEAALAARDSLTALPWLVDALAKESGFEAIGDDLEGRESARSPADDGRAQIHRLRIALTAATGPQLLGRWTLPGRVYEAHLSPSGEQLAIACDDGAAHVFSMRHGREVRRLHLNKKPRAKSLTSCGFEEARDDCDSPSSSSSSSKSGPPTRQPPPIRRRSRDYSGPIRRSDPRMTAVRFLSEKRLLTVGAKHFTHIRIWDLESGELEFERVGSSGRPIVSPDAATVAMKSSNTVQLYSTTDLQPLGPVLQHKGVNAVFFVANGRLLTVAEGVKIWDLKTGRSTDLLPVESRVRQVAVSAAGDWLAVLKGSGDLVCYDLSPKVKLRGSVFRPLRSPSDISLNRDGSVLAVASANGTVSCYRVPRGGGSWQMVAPPLVHGVSVASADYSPDGRHVLTRTTRGVMQVWEGAVAGFPITPPLGEVDDEVTWGPAGTHVIGRSEDRVEVWRMPLPLPQKVDEVIDVGRSVAGILQSPDRESALAWSNTLANRKTETLGFWGLSSKPQAFAKDAFFGVSAVAFSRDGKRFAMGQQGVTHFLLGQPGTVTCEKLPFVSEEQLQRDNRRDVQIATMALAFSPSGQKLLIGGTFRPQLWAVTKKPKRLIELPHEGPITAVGFGNDGRWMVTANGHGPMFWDKPKKLEARLWRVADGKPASPPIALPANARDVCFSPDDKEVAISTSAGVLLVDVMTGKSIAPLLAHAGHTLKARFSDEGRLIVSVGFDDMGAAEVRLWERASGFRVGPALPMPAVRFPRRMHPQCVHLRLTTDMRLVVEHPQQARTTRLQTRSWSLKGGSHDLEDLEALSRVRSGKRLNAAGGLVPVRPQEAWDAHFQRSLQRKPTDSAGRVSSWRRQQIDDCRRFRLWSSAAFHLDKLLEQLPDDLELHGLRAEVAANVHDYELALKHYGRRLQAGAASADFYRQRSEVFALLGRWNAAAKDLQSALSRVPEGGESERQAERMRYRTMLATCLIAAGEVEPFRRLARKLIDRQASKTNSRDVFPIARICVLAEGVTMQPQRLVDFATNGVDEFRPKSKELTVLALAHLRAKQLSQARETLSRSIRQSGGRLTVEQAVCRCLLLIASGETEAATKLHGQLSRWARSNLGDRGQPSSGPIDWQTRAWLEVLLSEVAVKLRTRAIATDTSAPRP